MSKAWMIAGALALVGTAMVPGAVLAQGNKVAIAAALADKDRPEADISRDAGRKPGELLAFAGVKPGMKVGELLPGGGYFTRLLSKAVGPTGVVYIWMPAGTSPERLARLDPILKNPAYANVKLVLGEQIATPEKVDLIWTTQNYHDLHHTGKSPEPTNAAALAALRPGGTYLVSDHAAKSGSGTTDTDELHRIDPELVKTEVVKAGFKFAEESKALANAEDDHTKKVFDLHDKTDQFLLKFTKPGK